MRHASLYRALRCWARTNATTTEGSVAARGRERREIRVDRGGAGWGSGVGRGRGGGDLLREGGGVNLDRWVS